MRTRRSKENLKRKEIGLDVTEKKLYNKQKYIFDISATFLEISKLRPRINHLIYPSKCLNIHL